MRIIRKISVLIMLSIVVSLLASCVSYDNTGNTVEEDYPLFSIVMAGIIGGEGGGTATKLETDEYGRILFGFDFSNIMGAYFNGLRGYGVCQKIEDGYAYYYDTYCFVILDDISDTAFTEISINNLLQLNDWGKPYNEELNCAKVKYITRKNDTNLFNISDEEIKNAWELFSENRKITVEGLEGLSKTIDYDIRYSCRDSIGKTLFYVAIGDRYSFGRGLPSNLYAIIVDENGNAGEDSTILFTDPYNCQDELSEFKEKNGWRFWNFDGTVAEAQTSETTVPQEDEYEYIDFEEWAHPDGVAAKKYFYSTNLLFEEGDVVHVDRLMEHYRLHEMIDSDTHNLRDELLQYRTHPDSDVYMESMEISIPKEIVNQKIEKHFAVKVDGSDSQYTDPDNEANYLLTHSATGGPGVAMKDYREDGNRTTAIYVIYDFFDNRIYRKVELCIENGGSEEEFRIVYARKTGAD